MDLNNTYLHVKFSETSSIDGRLVRWQMAEQSGELCFRLDALNDFQVS